MKLMYLRDVDLFLLLWKYRVLSTRAIWCALYDKVAIKTCYERLMKLAKANYIRCISVGENGSAWTLSVNGFQAIRDVIPELKVPGYGSESPTHDLMVLVAAFGDHWPSLPAGVLLLSEEEIKRVPLEYLPDWYPVDLLRRPDGLWLVQDGIQSTCIAFEMETTKKTLSSYEIIARQYQDASTVSRVVWFVSTLNVAELLQSAFQNRAGSHDFKHSFVLISDLVSNSWDAPVILGRDSGFSLCDFLKNQCGTASVQGRRLCHLDLSKTPHRSRAYGFSDPDGFSNSARHFKSTPFSTFIKAR